ncbi:MAG: UxaA family hydrolase [Lachnospiraceae bacterium]|jgi:altronate dehydratase large subunit|nr:UxaA family hydrolase [Lachnospiraceae bacterium]
MQYTFQGYRRPDGKVGARNLVAVIPTVICANDVGQAICRQVQGTIGYFHHQGCCQLPTDLKRVTDTLSNLGQSANVGAVLLVSLGCEGTDHARIFEEIRATKKPVEIIRIQELGGTSRAIQAGIDAAQRLVMEISGLQRETADASKIIMSIKCGASDSTSGLASNAVIGYVADKLVDLGGTVIFGETTEFLGGEHILANRAVGGADGPVGQKIYEIVNRMEARAKSIGEDMRGGQPTPGNIAGGLSSIEEKSLGAIVKSGHRPIQGVLEYCDRIDDKKGLWIKDAPGREPEILTGMACTGAQAMMFSTGRGAPQGFPSMPVIKICGNPNTFQHMEHDMDLNAGRIIIGEKSIEEVGEEAFALLLRVLSGQMTKNEALGYFGSMDIFCLGPVI